MSAKREPDLTSLMVMQALFQCGNRDGLNIETDEVRDLLILCRNMSETEADAAIDHAETEGWVFFGRLS